MVGLQIYSELAQPDVCWCTHIQFDSELCLYTRMCVEDYGIRDSVIILCICWCQISAVTVFIPVTSLSIFMPLTFTTVTSQLLYFAEYRHRWTCLVDFVIGTVPADAVVPPSIFHRGGQMGPRKNLGVARHCADGADTCITQDSSASVNKEKKPSPPGPANEKLTSCDC